MSLTTILFYLVISISICFYLNYLWKRRWLYYHSLTYNGPSPAWPLIGNALNFIGNNEDILSAIMKLYRENKSPFRGWLGPQLAICLSKPKDFEVVLNKALEKHPVYQFTTSLLGQGLLTAPVPLWKAHRKVMNPTFNQKILNDFVPIFARQAETLGEKLDQYVGHGIFDATKVLSHYHHDILCESIFGCQINAQQSIQESSLEHNIRRFQEIAFKRMFQVWLHPDFIFNLTGNKREMDQVASEIRKFVWGIIAKKKAEYRRKKSQKVDSIDLESDHKSGSNKVLLDYIIELSEEEAKWTDQEIFDETLINLAAGTDTSMVTDGFVLMMLGMHPKVQDKVYGELQEIFGGSNRPVTAEDLRHMDYLERTIKETLRIYPAIPHIARSVQEDIQLDADHIIPKGSSCVISIISLHRDPEIWPDPENFDPDRFLPEEVAKRHPYAYLPFSGGSRDCIGRRYGMMAVKSAIATLLRRFKVVKCPYQKTGDIKISQGLAIKAVNGYLIELERRN